MLFIELLSDGKTAVQAAIAGKNFPTSPHGDGTDQNIDRAGLNTLGSTFVIDARRVYVIVGIERLREARHFHSPTAPGITGSTKLRELRIQHAGKPYRVLYAFDPKRNAILLLGGNKTGTGRWYDTHVPKAEKLFAAYLTESGQAE